MDRRVVVFGLSAMGLAALNTRADATAEPFPISKAEIKKLPQRYRRKAIRFESRFAPGTIVVDTRRKYLYLVQFNGRAIRYGIGVGRQGFSWSGSAVIRRKAKWPTWTPPAAMVGRDKFAAEWAGGMPGGPSNPLGARALYLYQGNIDTLFRIHGTFVPSSIGRAVSSGCIRMLNADVADLYERTPVGTPVVVLQNTPRASADDGDAIPRRRNRRKFFLFRD